jgi:hypothetical protein
LLQEEKQLNQNKTQSTNELGTQGKTRKSIAKKTKSKKKQRQEDEHPNKEDV